MEGIIVSIAKFWFRRVPDAAIADFNISTLFFAFGTARE
jgi:hypothetical protein